MRQRACADVEAPSRSILSIFIASSKINETRQSSRRHIYPPTFPRQVMKEKTTQATHITIYSPFLLDIHSSCAVSIRANRSPSTSQARCSAENAILSDGPARQKRQRQSSRHRRTMTLRHVDHPTTPADRRRQTVPIGPLV